MYSSKDYFFTKEEFNVSYCESCSFVFTNPIPLESKIGTYYETEDYLSHTSDSKNPISLIYNKVRDINLNSKFNILNKYKSKAKALDIGCGTGEYLNYLKTRGWDVLGIEPNSKARNFINNNHKFDVQDISELEKLGKLSFDAISMWHVLEHVYDINERMQTIHRILKNDGIAIIALPMIDSPDSIKFGKYWAGLDLPRHLHHFSSDTFTKLANNNNFDVVDYIPMKFDSYYVSWLSRKAKSNSLAFVKGIVDGFISNLKANSKSNYSSMIFVLTKSKS